MAHHIKTRIKPHINKDGSKSETKKDYIVTHRHRKVKTVVGVFASQKSADAAVLEEKTRTFGPQQ